ncbi:hypothetical protein ACHQM5_019250 [Ranunculus cassubicifolius]
MIHGGHDSIYLTNYASSFTKAVEIDYPLKSSESIATILGSCNGIYLIGTYSKSVRQWGPYTENRNQYTFEAMCLWNPATREYKQLPSVLLTIPTLRLSCKRVVYGLGYDALTDDFKVIRILYFLHYLDNAINTHRFESEVSVYSSRMNSGNRIQDIPYMILNYVTAWCLSTGLYVNGTIHWLGRLAVQSGIPPFHVVCFDIANEEFREMEGPDLGITSYASSCITFGLFEECLCIQNICLGSHVDVFVMKEYGVKESWSKMFSIVEPQGLDVVTTFCKVLCITNGGKLLGKWNGEDVSLYDVEEGKHVPVEVHGLPKRIARRFRIDYYVESLLSLESGIFVGC